MNYRLALKRANSKLRRVTHKALGVKEPKTIEDWRKALAGRDIEEVQKIIEYWARGDDEA